MKFQVLSSEFQVRCLNFKEQRTKNKGQIGFTLFELIATLTVLAILVMGTIPLMQNAARRQKELRLRETLRTVREAIDQFHLDAYGACPEGAVTTTNPIQGRQQQGAGNAPTDPRTRVVIDDCTIFDSQNLDRYPPSLDVLVEGVKVKPRGLSVTSGAGLGDDDRNATDLNSADTEELTKVYLREMPFDPMTGETDWNLRSSYQTKESESWDDINVFDLRSTSDGEALNGEKYSDW